MRLFSGQLFCSRLLYGAQLAANANNYALQLILQLKESGIECPRDISICGYGNMPFANFLHPVTSVDQFAENMGYTACSKLIKIIEKRNSDPLPIQLFTPVKLVNPNATVGYVAN